MSRARVSRSPRKPARPARTRTQERRKRRLGPRSRDRHWLYQEAVQSPGFHVAFMDRVYARNTGRPPRFLKEDFCGTALLSTEWVRTRPDNFAVGVDLDRDTLRWAREHNLSTLGRHASRVRLVRANVLDVHAPRVDVVAAFNFSFGVFKTFSDLVRYFRSVRRSLRPGGAFCLDVFGGWETQMVVTDRTTYKGFTYVWEQRSFDPVTNNAVFHIHFKFHGGGGIRRAFCYDWRMWSVPEVRDALEGAGFDQVDVYWEGFDPKAHEGNGVYRRVKRARNTPGWIAFVVAF